MSNEKEKTLDTFFPFLFFPLWYNERHLSEVKVILTVTAHILYKLIYVYCFDQCLVKLQILKKSLQKIIHNTNKLLS